MKVLLAEDDSELQKVYEGMLTGFGYEVDVYPDGREATIGFKKALSSGKPYDLVISDFLMPPKDRNNIQWNGDKLLDNVDWKSPTTPFIFMTTEPSLVRENDYIGKLVEERKIPILQKPVFKEQLKEVIDDVLS